jgi:RNA 3'-phosphate cyclase
MNEKNTILIDGSYGEGGGQILRTASALSAITGMPCRIINIRKNRRKPGLAHQHVIGLRALRELCDGRLQGDSIGSLEIAFHPGRIKPRTLHVEIPTAGSVTLVMQTLLLPALTAPGRVTVNFHGGGTDTFFSPSMDYYRFVFLKILQRIGLTAEIKITKRGFYPKGGARVTFDTSPGRPGSWRCTERGELRGVTIISGASDKLKERGVAERQAKSAEDKLKSELKRPIEQKIEYSNTFSAGSFINIVADFEHTTIGTDGLGERGRRAEVVGEETAIEFLKEFNSGACLDKHAGDQIVPFISLAEGKSEVTISEIRKHTSTNIWVVNHFLDRSIELRAIDTKTALSII